ncbi:MAG: response regulator transcription factor, partial [Patescibacteria group bacterium]|nr:response regulator transcription factor [Patescibacteria group bacterium]
LLSPTQERILNSFEQGQRHKETASQLGISLNTLKTHVRLILAKTGTRTCIEAAYRRRQVVH